MCCTMVAFGAWTRSSNAVSPLCADQPATTLHAAAPPPITAGSDGYSAGGTCCLAFQCRTKVGSGWSSLHPHVLPLSLLLPSVPIALDVVLLQKRLPAFLGWSAASLALILGPVVAVDYHYYGRLLCTPLNIVLYNVLGGRGPELYGTEPWSFYLINGALNFNVLFPLALAAPPLAVVKVGD